MREAQWELDATHGQADDDRLEEIWEWRDREEDKWPRSGPFDERRARNELRPRTGNVVVQPRVCPIKDAA